MVFLLLRLVTTLATPEPPAAANAVVENNVAAKQAPAAAPGANQAAAQREARAHLQRIEAGPARIRWLMRGAEDEPFKTSCVGQRLAEAQVHTALAREEMRRLAA